MGLIREVFLLRFIFLKVVLWGVVLLGFRMVKGMLFLGGLLMVNFGWVYVILYKIGFKFLSVRLYVLVLSVFMGKIVIVSLYCVMVEIVESLKDVF